MGDDFAMGYAMGQDNNNNCNGGDWFGGGGIWGLLILALLFGWGGAGFGGGGLFGGMFGGAGNGALTRADINAGFQFNDLQNSVRGIERGLCDGFYNLNTSLLTGFNGIQSQIASCCCENSRLLERGFCDVGYALATNTNNIIQSQHSDADRVIAKLDAMETARQAEKIEALRLENQTLKFQASQSAQNAFITANQEAQTAELIRRLGRDCPIPAYVVPNPNCCYGNPVGVSYAGCGNGCGCGGFTT